MIRHVVDSVGDFKFVAAHMGGWKNWNEVLQILGDTKIFIDTAFSTGKIIPRSDFIWNADDLKLLSAAEFMKFVEVFGADRILFGTDSPWSDQSSSLKFINALPLSNDDKNKILGLNAKRLLEI